jgi:hypothetical protein
MIHPTQLIRRASALLFAAVALIGTVAVSAQTVFLVTGLSGSVAGAPTSVAANGPALYNITGLTSNNITALTFGNGFTMTATGPTGGAFDNSFIYGGTISGSSIAAATAMPISYNFTLAKGMVGIPGDATWVLKFADSVNTSNQQIATGTLSAASATFTGSGNYNFTSGVSSGATFLATIQVTYTGNLAMEAPLVTGTMTNTGFGGEGITLNATAIPEPSTYAAIAGAAMLGFAVWSRRRRSTTVA